VVEGLEVGGSETSGSADDDRVDADGNPLGRDDDDDDDEQANMSLAAMEAALKPRVLETLDRIARDYGGLAEMQDLRMSATLNEDNSFDDHGRGGLPEAAVRDRGAGERAAPAQQPDRGADRPALRHQPPDHVDRQRHGEAGRSGPHQPPRIHRRVPRLRTGPDLARAHGCASRGAAGSR
jgi:hypothetical protein